MFLNFSKHILQKKARDLDSVSLVKKRGQWYCLNKETDYKHKYILSSIEKNFSDSSTISCSSKRKVLLCNTCQCIIKKNRITGFGKVIKYYLSSQNKFSLIHEYCNLTKISPSKITPKAYAFSISSSFFSIEETLILEYYKNSLTLNVYASYSDKNIYNAVSLAFDLFLQSWKDGFTHLDPHLDNILIVNGYAKFIDFEGCKLNTIDKESHFGFLMGRFYEYWYYKYLTEDQYDNLVYSFLSEEKLEINSTLFDKTYKLFKKGKKTRNFVNRYFFDSAFRKLVLV